MKKSASAPSGLMAPEITKTGRGIKKMPSVSMLQEESEPEDDGDRGGAKVGKQKFDVSES
jgi:hypothetical protein